MADKLKEIQAKVLEWWNRFTSKQKTIIVGIAAAVLFTFVLVIYFFNKPQFTRLLICENTADAAEVIGILDGAGITHRESDDGLKVEVVTSQISEANIALGAGGYAPDDYTPDDALNGGFSMTESDKQKRWGVYLERQLEKDLQQFNGIKNAKVLLDIPDQDGTLLSKEMESWAYIHLDLDDTFIRENAANLARAAATFLGNKTTANITIVDGDGNMLFDGTDNITETGIASNSVELRSQAESMIASKVRKVLLGTGQYNMVEVAPQLEIDFSNYKKTVSEYYANEGRDEGMKSHEDRAETETENGGAAGGPPGTDSNNETDYMLEDGLGQSSSSSSESSTDYLPNQSMEEKITPAGGINFEDSAMAIACISFREIKEEDAKAQGLLDGVTWDEYKAANKGQRTKLEVDPDFYSMVSNATNIAPDKITILAYEELVFYDKDGLGIKTTDVLSIMMLVMILGLLGFVVLRSMRVRHAVVEEEELSVENLLQSTPEEELEDIEIESKSDTRKLIEKFVDENPEAAANLLRNWLNEDWS